ncbi:MAG: hypothetical protein U0840_11385 [Gemmataceae bacterium]
MEPKDRVTEVLLEALRQALAVPGEHRLYRAGKLEGLFPGRSGVGGEAAERAMSQGLVQRTRVETRGKTEIDWVEIAPAGVDFLHRYESPLEALHELRASLRSSQGSLPGWLADMQTMLAEVDSRLRAESSRWQQRLEAMERRLADTLRRLEAASPLVPPEVLEAHVWAVDGLNYLDRRRAAGATGPCPLPELYDAIAKTHPNLELSAFQEGLRQLRQRRAIELRPLDDPEQMTRPEFALLDGDAVFYLALR